MDRYQRIEKPRTEIPINENEIRITTQGAIRNYISYATSLLQEKRLKEIVFRAMGQAISKTVAIVEILKKRTRLHQDTVISSVSLTDIWEPIEEGLVPVETTRQVSMITITLSTKELNKNSSGYQAPHHVQQPKQQYYSQQLQPRHTRPSYNNAGNEDSYGRGRGRGRGTGQGWGRGGYGNYQYQDNGGNANWGQSGGRGGGWGYQGAGYERRGRGGGSRGYGHGRGRMGGRSRGGGYRS